MESSAVNKAHQQHRKAEIHLRHRRFDESIECQQAAADLFSDALTRTTNPRSIESLKLQRDFHLRQKDVILIKKEQFENYKKAIENQRQKKLQSLCINEYEDNQDSESLSLQMAIYRTIEETDSLLGLLVKKSATNSDSESLKSFSTTDTDDRVSVDIIDCPNPSALLGSKHPKDDTVVIEELRILNTQLHDLVYQLVTQLDARVKEVDCLKETIKRLESNNIAQTKNSNNLKVVTDSSGGTSPYVFSPCSELSPDVHDGRALPPLAPLELPNFDITNFMKNNANHVDTTN